MKHQKNFFKAFTAYRHRRGFGVHSPSAFVLVNEVIRSPYSYYAYDKINDSLPRDKARTARLLHRMVARVRPSCVFFSPNIEPGLRQAVMLADSRLEEIKSLDSFRDRGLAVLSAPDQKTVEKVLSHPEAIVIMERKQKGERIPVEEMMAIMPDGVLFYDENTFLAVRKTGMQLLSYRCKI